ncbi:hypothetical protein OV203_38490 [Nannocystis sp. ILAH1]|uniref:hypothetical protein n=1 Tax=Nannocystis sp. ILAH1 TaxID=2996789 RepID=UPI002271979E|nr:hypothetical protein [Nannocystis sp. ILAH1]MCY0993093.1 hypothetical protein [Nannocystis sp. ILAH1]
MARRARRLGRVLRLDDDRAKPGASGLPLFTPAMGAHFVVNDYGLRHDHRRRYHDIGR